MTVELIEKVKQYFEHNDIPIVGAADAEILNQTAPEGFRPKDVLEGAKSVIVFAKPAPLTAYLTPPTHGVRNFYIASYHTYYRMANEVANAICYKLNEAGFPSLPIPSYSPLKFENGHFNGMMSFKHIAEAAGLGKIGKSTLLLHPERGNTLRFGGLVTTFEWPTGEPQEFPDLCPKDCHICEEVCPVGALKDGEIDHFKCMSHCIEHTLRPPLWMMKLMRSVFTKRWLNVYSNSFFENYGVSCCECQKQCPRFPANMV